MYETKPAFRCLAAASNDGLRIDGPFFTGEAKPIIIDLASAIGPDVPPIVVLSMLRKEAISKNLWDYFVRTVFVRSVSEHFPAGWMTGRNADFQTAGVYGNWCASVGIDYYEPAGGIRDRIGAPEFMPTGWLPAGPDDEVVMKLFAGLTFAAPSNCE